MYDINDFRIEPMLVEKHDEYMEFLRVNYFPRENLALGLHIDLEEEAEILREPYKAAMYSGTSMCAIYIPTNELAGVMMCKVFTRNDNFSMTVPKDKMEGLSQNTKYGRKITEILTKACNPFEDSKVQKAWQIEATTVAPKFTGIRLAHKLHEESERRAIELGCQVGISQSTSAITQHLRKKMGFQECYSLNYATFEIDGKKVIDMDVITYGTTCAQSLKKYLCLK